MGRMARAPERRGGRAVRILLGAGLLAAGLVSAEIGLRTWAHYFREDVAVWDPRAGTYALVPGRHETAAGVVVVNPAGFVGEPLAPDGPDLWRVVALGDSCTFGAGDGVDTYPAMLERRLEAEGRSGRRYEVVNAAISGLFARDALRRLRAEVPPLAPEVVTVYVGWNDLMKRSPLSQQPSRAFSDLAHALDRLWLTRGLRKLLFLHLRSRLLAPATGPESDRGRFDDFRPLRYEATLERIVEATRALGARPLLATLPTVLRPWMNSGELRRARVVFPYLARTHAVGDFLDLIAAYNRSIRAVAERRSVPLVDLARRFRALEEPRPFFYDTMHPNPAGMRRIARWLHEALGREGLLDRAHGVPRAGPPARGGG